MNGRIKVEGLSRCYGRLVALDDVSFSVTAGKCFCLLGRNGAGKTTLLNCMTALDRPDSGAVFYDGARLDEDATAIKARLGVLPERDPTIPELTGLQYLAFVCFIRNLPPPPDNQRVQELAERLLESGEPLHRRIATYSHGMRIKLGLCAALVGDPDFLVLDEPFSNLDPVSSAHLVELLRENREQGRTLLISSHHLGPVQRLATDIGVLDHGRLIFAGSIAEFGAGAEMGLEGSLLQILGVRRGAQPDRPEALLR